MENDIKDLYQEVILDHGRKPRNFRELADPTGQANGHNPLCGDRCTVYLKSDGETISDVSFQGAGCAISTASASMMTQVVKGRKVSDILDMFEQFHTLVTTDDPPAITGDEEKLMVFAGVRDYPSRVKCATLAWHTLKAALESTPEPVSTE